MKYENVDFPEALRLLADRAGVVLPKFRRENAQENAQKEQYKETLLRINDLAARYYHEVLVKSSLADVARKYLQNRGLSQETVDEWMIGFAPNEFHLLENFLLKKSFAKNDLVKA